MGGIGGELRPVRALLRPLSKSLPRHLHLGDPGGTRGGAQGGRGAAPDLSAGRGGAGRGRKAGGGCEMRGERSVSERTVRRLQWLWLCVAFGLFGGARL